MDKKELQEESQNWVDNNIISEEQRDNILSTYEGEGSAPSGLFNRAKYFVSNNSIKLIALAGGLFLALGVLSLILLLIDMYNLGKLGQSFLVYPMFALGAAIPYYLKENGWHRYLTTIFAFIFTASIPLVGRFTVNLFELYVYTLPSIANPILLFISAVITTVAAIYYQSKLSALIPLTIYPLSITMFFSEYNVINQFIGGDATSFISVLLYGVILYSLSVHLRDDSIFKPILTWAGVSIPLSIMLFFIIGTSEFTTSIENVIPLVPAGVVLGGFGVIAYKYKNTERKMLETISSIALLILFSITLIFIFISFSTESILFTVGMLGYIIAYGLLTVAFISRAIETNSTGLFNISGLFFFVYISYLYYDYVISSLGGVFSFILLGIILIGVSILLKQNKEKTKSILKDLY